MERPIDTTVPSIVREVAARFAALPEVVAVAVAGSRATGVSDGASDIDLYVFAEPAIPVAARAAIAAACAAPGWREIDNRFWGPGDEWPVTTGDGLLGIDLMYFPPVWMEEQLERVLVRHEASLGYTTCFWHTARQAHALFDRDAWFARLQAVAARPYPEPLRRAIVALNHPPLRTIHSSLLGQLAHAAARGDTVSIHHRLTAILVSYFDILFAVNRQTHPGEKRLVAHALACCPRLPANFPAAMDLALAAPPDGAMIDCVYALLDDLDALLDEEGLRSRANSPGTGASAGARLHTRDG